MNEQATIHGHVGAGERLPFTVEPGRDPDHAAVLSEVRKIAAELERLGYALDAEILQALAASLSYDQLARGALAAMTVLERRASGAAKRELRTGAAMVRVYAGTKRRALSVAGRHLGEVEQYIDGHWWGHMAEAFGGSTLLDDGEGPPNLPRLVEAMLAKSVVEERPRLGVDIAAVLQSAVRAGVARVAALGSVRAAKGPGRR